MPVLTMTLTTTLTPGKLAPVMNTIPTAKAAAPAKTIDAPEPLSEAAPVPWNEVAPQKLEVLSMEFTEGASAEAKDIPIAGATVSSAEVEADPVSATELAHISEPVTASAATVKALVTPRKALAVSEVC